MSCPCDQCRGIATPDWDEDTIDPADCDHDNIDDEGYCPDCASWIEDEYTDNAEA